ncbi:Protein argonaute-2 [Strongyloides ratti]|uniref:Protein argonaute-2 n=1 Tax=Strongyloides ratti TaxID=34506 RepID=A0A090L8X3_STRRB|nr:Protein argonaute-2 [Strongyloides ratti]CEF63970.1 Protein argonaute-2 [Strongyloides ratti]
MDDSKILSSQTFVIKVDEKSIGYRYFVGIDILSKKSDTTWKVSGDGGKKLHPIMKLELLQACKSLVLHAFEMKNGFGDKNTYFIYDGASNLISSKEITKEEVIIPSSEVPIDTKVISKGRSVRITLKPQSKFFELDIGNINKIVHLPVNDEEKSIIFRFLENLVISPFMYPFKKDDEGYITQLGSGKNFIRLKPEDDSSKTCGDGRCVIPGITRSLVELNLNDKPSIALSFDYSENVYYKGGNLATIIQEITKSSSISYSTLQNAVNNTSILGVYLKTNHRKNGNIFKLKNSFTRESGRNKIITIKKEDKERSISVSQYFEERYNRKLKYPDWPLFIKMEKKVTYEDGEKISREYETYYPLEVLDIIPGQCVPVPKMDSLSSKVQQRINTKGPLDRKRNTYNELYRMGMFDRNIPLFKSFGISLEPKASFFSGEVLSDVLYTPKSSRPLVVQKGKISNNRDNVCNPTSLKKELYIVYWNAKEDYIKDFSRKYIEICEKNGIIFHGPPIIQEVKGDFRDVNKAPDVFAKEMNRIIKNFDNSFLIYIDSKFEKSHLALKYYEQKFGVLTQHLTLEVVKNLPTKYDSMKNVINKTNAKLGGSNFKIDLKDELSYYNVESKNVLYIGFDINTSSIGSMTADSTINVGSWAANVSKNREQFISDYWYQMKNDYLLFDDDQMKLEIEKIFRKWRKNISDKPPKTIIVFRTGLSQANFQASCNEEVDNFEKCVNEFSDKIFKSSKIPYSWIYVNRTSNLRLYNKDDKGCPTNIEAGTYVYKDLSILGNSRIVGKSYANCLGTAKLPLYTLGRDTNSTRLDAEKIMNIVNMLCYKYDIISSAVSLPAVSYIAIETSKRGNNNLLAEKNDQSTQYTQDDDIKRKNQNLSYTNSKLNELRFNA